MENYKGRGPTDRVQESLDATRKFFDAAVKFAEQQKKKKSRYSKNKPKNSNLQNRRFDFDR